MVIKTSTYEKFSMATKLVLVLGVFELSGPKQEHDRMGEFVL